MSKLFFAYILSMIIEWILLQKESLFLGIDNYLFSSELCEETICCIYKKKKGEF